MSNDIPAPEPPAPSSRNRWGNRMLLVLFGAVAVPVAATVLYNFSPTAYTFYPKCFFFWATGLHCPGCGATRCTAALLHGDLEQALAYNALFVLILPLAIYGGLRIAFEMWTGKPTLGFRMPAWSMKLLAVMLFAFWIARNIPVYPLTLLAPHER